MKSPKGNMEVIAIAKNIRISPQKVRLVIAEIKKMSPASAIGTLTYTNKAAAKPIRKVIASAIANANNNFGLLESTLAFKSLVVEQGRTFKRFKAISRGRAHPIIKRTSHIKVILVGEKPKEVSKERENEKGEQKSK